MGRMGHVTFRLADLKEEMDSLAVSMACNRSHLMRAALRAFTDLSDDKRRTYLKKAWIDKGRRPVNGKKA